MKRYTALLLGLALLTPGQGFTQTAPAAAATKDVTCPDASVLGSAPIDASTRSILWGRQRDNRCALYVEPAEGATPIRLALTFTGPITNPAVLQAADAVRVSDSNPNQVVLELPSPPGESHTFSLSGKVGEAAFLIPIRVSVAPSIALGEAQSGCPAGTICLDAGRANKVTLAGRHLHEIAGPAVYFQEGTANIPFAVSAKDNYLEMDFPRPPGLDTTKTYRVWALLRERELIEGFVRDTVQIPAVRIKIVTQPLRTITFLTGKEGSQVDAFYTGQVQAVHPISDRQPLGPDTYTLTEPNVTTPIGYLEVQNDGTTVFSAVGTTSADNGRMPVKVRGTPAGQSIATFETRLRVAPRPAVTGVKIFGVGGSYGADTLRAGVTSRVVVTGPQASLFTPSLPDQRGNIPDSDAGGLPNERRFSVTPAADFSEPEMSVRLSATGVDTVLKLPVRPHLRVRPLDFITLARRTGRPGKLSRGCMRSNLQNVSLNSATAPLDACSLADAALVFSEDSLGSRADAFGPQYLKITATLRSPSEDVVRTDSVKWVIAPPGSELQPGYETGASLPLTRLVGGLGRFSRPGSTLNISIQHDPARYPVGGGLPRSIRVRDARRFSVSGVAGVAPLTGYLARKDVTTTTRAPVLNGTPADTLVALETKRDWESGLATIGFYAGLDLRTYWSDSRETPYKARVAGYHLNSPYATKNIFVFALMYPIEFHALNGALEFSLTPGVAATPGERPFGLLSTNIGLTSGAKP